MNISGEGALQGSFRRRCTAGVFQEKLLYGSISGEGALQEYFSRRCTTGVVLEKVCCRGI